MTWDHPRLTREQFAERVAEVAADTTTEPGSGWWLSFTDTERPKGTQFLGAIFTKAASLPDAISTTHRLGVNPGGGIAIMGPISPDATAKVPERFVNVLMDRETCEEFDRTMEAMG